MECTMGMSRGTTLQPLFVSARKRGGEGQRKHSKHAIVTVPLSQRVDLNVAVGAISLIQPAPCAPSTTYRPMPLFGDATSAPAKPSATGVPHHRPRHPGFHPFKIELREALLILLSEAMVSKMLQEMIEVKRQCPWLSYVPRTCCRVQYGYPRKERYILAQVGTWVRSNRVGQSQVSHEGRTMCKFNASD